MYICCEHRSHLAICWLVFHMVVQVHEMRARTTVLPAMYCSAHHTVLIYHSGIQVVYKYLSSRTLLKRGREINMSPTAVSWWHDTVKEVKSSELCNDRTIIICTDTHASFLVHHVYICPFPNLAVLECQTEVSDNGFLHYMHKSFSNNMVPKWITQQVFNYMHS